MRGALAHGIGRTKGGRDTKRHAFCHEKERPHVLLLTPGNTHDAKFAMLAISAVPASQNLVADKGYDSNALRLWLVVRGTAVTNAPAAMLIQLKGIDPESKMPGPTRDSNFSA